VTGPERSDGLVGDGQCVCAADQLVADSMLFGCLCRPPAHSRVVPHSAVVPRAVVEDCPARFMLASLESSPRARPLAQQHLAEDGPIDPAPSGAAWRPGHLARLGQCEGSRTDGLQVCGDTGQRCEQGIAQLSQSLRIVISQRPATGNACCSRAPRREWLFSSTESPAWHRPAGLRRSLGWPGY
jgi:hypothetical protein